MRYVYPLSPFFIYISRMFLLSGEGKHKSVFKKKTKLFLNPVRKDGALTPPFL